MPELLTTYAEMPCTISDLVKAFVLEKITNCIHITYFYTLLAGVAGERSSYDKCPFLYVTVFESFFHIYIFISSLSAFHYIIALRTDQWANKLTELFSILTHHRNSSTDNLGPPRAPAAFRSLHGSAGPGLALPIISTCIYEIGI